MNLFLLPQLEPNRSSHNSWQFLLQSVYYITTTTSILIFRRGEKAH